MITEINFVIGIISIISFIIVAYFSYVIYKYNKFYKGWLILFIAFIIIIFRRGLGLITELSLPLETRNLLKVTEGILLLVISILYIWGFWEMKKDFEFLGKKVQQKAKSFFKSKRK